MLLALTTGKAQFAVALFSAIVAGLFTSLKLNGVADRQFFLMDFIASTLLVLRICWDLMPFLRRLSVTAQVDPASYYVALVVPAFVSINLAAIVLKLFLAMTLDGLWFSYVVTVAMLVIASALYGGAALLATIALLTALGASFVLALQMALTTIEFILRRIAETSSGPVIGASVVLGSIGAAIKAFS